MDGKNVETLLEEEIRRNLTDLKSCVVGTHERAQAIEELEKLYKLRLEEQTLDTNRNDEKSRKDAEALDRKIRLGVDIASLVLPLLFYGRWMAKGFEFEKTGSFTSVTFRNLINKFRPGR